MLFYIDSFFSYKLFDINFVLIGRDLSEYLSFFVLSNLKQYENG